MSVWVGSAIHAKSVSDVVRPPLMPTEFAEKYLEFNGKPFSIGIYEYMRIPMNDMSRHRHFVWARQCGKSLAFAANTLAYTSMHSNTTVTMISSAGDNVSVYESQKLGPLMQSPKWRNGYYDYKAKDNVKLKQLRNGSSIILRGAFSGGARVRGISGGEDFGSIFIDELQHIERDTVEDAESILARSATSILTTAGTQSHMESAVNFYFEKSTQNEWMLRCSHCSKWSDPLGVAHIGRLGLICTNCGKSLNALTDRNRWVRASVKDAPISGYRFPLIALPGHPWKDIIYKMENWVQSKFMIDVMALPIDALGKPLGRAELQASCDESYMEWLTPAEVRGRRCVAGVDWGKNQGSTTQIFIMVEMGLGKLKLAYAKKFLGAESDPLESRRIIADLIYRYNAQVVVLDEGGQTEANKELRKHFGTRKIQSVYLSHGLKETMVFNVESGHWVASKPKTLTHTFMTIKKGGFIFPAWSKFQEFGNELLSEIVEYGEDGLPHYSNPKDQPDDSLHALNFCFLAWRFLISDFKLPNPPGAAPMFSSG